jgi:hypothetical protein
MTKLPDRQSRDLTTSTLQAVRLRANGVWAHPERGSRVVVPDTDDFLEPFFLFTKGFLRVSYA